MASKVCNCAKYKAATPPRTNCKVCWEKYFKANIGRCRALMSAYDRTIGKARLVTMLGDKFVRNLERFRSEHGL